MLIKYIITLLFVYSTTAISSFLEKGKRPEYFELTDNIVPTIKVSISDDELALLKTQADYTCNRAGTPTLNIGETLQQYQYAAKMFIELLKLMNFNEAYPNVDFSSVLPELNIGEDGHPNLNTMEILSGFNFNFDDYRFRDYANNPIIFQIFMSNPNFNAIKVALTLNKLPLAEGYQINPNLQAILAMAVNNSNYNEFKTKNATMTIDINNQTEVFDKITFSLGGKSSLCFSKPGYNIKIRGDKDLFGRNQFKLRSESADPSFLRSKLASDVYISLGLPCISTNYATLYINDEYMGLFTISDAYKSSWIESEYGDKNTSSLYKCDVLSYLTLVNSPYLCENINDEVTDSSEFVQFLTTLDKAQSAADIEDIFEVDHFLTEMALEYILGSWDRILHQGHNYYMYKQPNGKWIYLAHDFDHEFGINMDRGIMGPITLDSPERVQKLNFDYPNYSFDDWETRHLHIIDILIRKDTTRFDKILKNIVEKVFNPATLYPHIDELKELIKPYVESDYKPLDDGKLPGRINDIGDEFYSYAQWDANIEFTSVPTDQYFAYGIKYWILAKYRYLCNTYDLECDETYLDKNYSYTVNKDVEFTGYDWKHYFPDFDMKINSPGNDTNPIPTENKPNDCWAENLGYSCCSPENTYIYSSDENGDWGFDFENQQWCGIISNNKSSQNSCWSELIGYPCCSSENTTVYQQDEYGDWGYDFTKQEWCGISYYEEPTNPDETCWSKKLGYPCCKGCKLYSTDDDGSWGYESNQWCGIQSFCKN